MVLKTRGFLLPILVLHIRDVSTLTVTVHILSRELVYSDRSDAYVHVVIHPVVS